MKNSKIMLLAGIAAAAMSCQKELPGSNQNVMPSGEGWLSIAVGSGVSTKAGGDVTLRDLELTVSDVQIAIFSAEGNAAGKAGYRQFYGTYGAQTLDGERKTSSLAEMTLPAGDYKVYAVVNGPDVSGVATEQGLLDIQAPFDEWNDSHDLVQVGSADVTVNIGSTKETPATVVVPVKRLASRVKLAYVKNDLPEAYGAVSLKRVFLANVVKNEVLGADANLSASNWAANVTSSVENYWGNCWGRSAIGNAASLIGKASGNTAYSPENTYFQYASPVSIAHGVSSEDAAHYFHCYANPSLDYIVDPTALTENAWDASKATTELVAVVEVFDGTASLGERYYRVPLRYSAGHGATSVRNDATGLLPNHAYSVGLTLTALGPEDFVAIEKGYCSVDIKVSEWDEGDMMESVL